MRILPAGVLTGLVLLLAVPEEASSTSSIPKTPPPTVAVIMVTPTGTQSNPTLDATWHVGRPGIQGALIVQGKTVDTPGVLPNASAAPIPAPFLTTVTATWTSELTAIWDHSLGANVVLSWNDGIPPGTQGSRQLLRIRYCNSKGRWGRWTNLYDKPFTDSTVAFLTTGGPTPAVFDPIKYPGKVPAKKIRVQFSLTDTLPQGALLQQVLSIDLDPNSHGIL